MPFNTNIHTRTVVHIHLISVGLAQAHPNYGVYPVQIAESVVLTNEITAIGLVTMDTHDIISMYGHAEV